MSRKSNHIPIRTCVACGKKDDKKKMIRIADNQYDNRQKLTGRGFYVCPTIECINKAKKGKKNKIDSETAEIIKSELENNG